MILAYSRADLSPRARATLADLEERRAALITEIDCYALWRRLEPTYRDRKVALEAVERRISLIVSRL